MNYRKLLDRYKEGLATEEEKRFVEQEIEKYEAVEEYLSGILEEELDALVEVSDFEKEDTETAKLKKSVNLKLRKMVLTAVLIIVALYLGIFYVVSPGIDSLYYNPGKATVGKADMDMSFDVYAISQLNLPGMSPSTVLVDRQGFGEYNVMYSYQDVFTEETYGVNERIKRGEIVSSHREIPLYSTLFQDIRNPYYEERNLAEKKGRVTDHLKALNSVSYVSLGIQFENDLTMEELYELELKYPDIVFQWAGIRTDPSAEGANELIGIQLLRSSSNTALLGDEKIREDYPAFFILDWLVSPAARKNDQKPVEAQAYEHHYKSLLKYVIDREEAVGVLEHRSGKNKFYEFALRYAEENGVKAYGILVFGEAKDLIELTDAEDIKSLDFNQALVSKRI